MGDHPSDEERWEGLEAKLSLLLERLTPTAQAEFVPAAPGSGEPVAPGVLAAVPGESVRFDVFVAHASADTAAAETLYDALLTRGLRVFVDTRSLQPGDWWDDVLPAAQAASIVTVVVISEHTEKAFYAREEIAAAINLARVEPGRRVVPVYLGPMGADGPYGLQRVQGLSAANGWGPVVEAVAGLFHRAVAEAPAATALRVWSGRVPRLPRVTVQRPQVLTALDGTGAGVVRALVGAGGVGKSTAAAVYVWQRRQAGDVEVVWWVRAQAPLTLVTDLVELAPLVGVVTADVEPESVATQVRMWLESTSSSWVIVFDNATEPNQLERWLPATGQGRVVITSRYQGWTALAAQRSVDVFDHDTAVQFLVDRVGEANPAAAADRAGIEDAADRLDGLPLALEQAAAYVARPGRTWPAYLALFDQKSTNPYPDNTRPVGYEATAYTTWQVSIAAASATAPLAGRLLAACGFLAPDAIPINLFTDPDPDPDPDTAATPYLDGTVADVYAGFDALYDYALATPHGDTLSVHRVVQDAARRTAPTDTLAFIARTLRRVFPDPNDPATWPDCSALAPHIQATATHHPTYSLDDATDLWWVLDDVGIYLRAAGQPHDAVAVHRTALTLAETTMDPDDSNVFTARASLAFSYWAAGRTADAIPLEEQVLADRERLFDPDHPNTLTARGNLAESYRLAGRVADAITLQESVLADRERILGPDDPNTLTARNSLAVSYAAAGRIADAVTLHEAVLADRERVLGPDHPDTLTARGNLGESYRLVGRTADAVALEEAVLADRERILGAEHPDTLTTRNNLAASYADAGRVADAIPLQEAVLADRERILGAEHPETLTARNNLAFSYSAIGRTGDAVILQEAVLADRERILGPDHPDTVIAASNLAACYAADGRLADAIPLQESVVAQLERILGPDDPNTVVSRNNLASFLSNRESIPDDADG
ncbi:MAG TPA: FxSxx-COOH system tetratricopeptide repeat protein [Acidimicrobiales bacterium]